MASVGAAGLSPQHRRLLWLLGVASFFEGYDFSAVTVALPQLRDTFGLSQSTASLWVAILYLGAAPALWLSRYADRAGRRRALLISITGYTIATAATALVPSIEAFVGVQFAARLFLAAEIALAWTVVAEELPADRRGLGFGILALASALGSGWASILQGALLAPLHGSWRWLYAAAVPVLVVAALLRRSLPESSRFATVAGRDELVAHWTVILRPPHRGRLVLLATTAFLLQMTSQAIVFVVDFMQTQRGLSPSAANFTLVASGALALPLLVVAGRLSDRIGRKPIACVSLCVATAGLVCFFFLARTQVELFLGLALTYAGTFGAWPTGGSFASEMFPTALRAFGNSAVGMAKLLGQFSSFMLAGALIAATGGLSTAVLILSAGPILGAVLIAARFPETGGRDLDEVSSVTLPPYAGVTAVPEPAAPATVPKISGA